MTPPHPSHPSSKFVTYLSKTLLAVCLQLLVPDCCLADLVVKEKDFADLQLDHLQTQAQLVEDKTLPLECRRQVKNSIFDTFVVEIPEFQTISIMGTSLLVLGPVK